MRTQFSEDTLVTLKPLKHCVPTEKKTVQAIIWGNKSTLGFRGQTVQHRPCFFQPEKLIRQIF